MKDHRKKLKILKEQEKPDTTYSNNTFSKQIAKFVDKYGRIILFLVGLFLFFIGFLGEIKGLDGYTYFSKSRLIPDGVRTEPYWFSCVYGVGFMLTAIRRKWLVSLFTKNK